MPQAVWPCQSNVLCLLLRHLMPMAQLQVNMHGANVTSWKRPDGVDILHMRPDSPLDGSSPIL